MAAAKFLVIVQARMASTRLPGKVLREVGGKPLFEYQLERLRRKSTPGDILIATSSNLADDVLAEFCKERDIACFRGSEEDVLDRFYQAARSRLEQNLIRVTADCPLLDPGLLDAMVAEFQTCGVDYLSNTLLPTYPDGMDIEIFSRAALERAWQEAALGSEREHVTPYIWKNSDYKGGTLFTAWNYTHPDDFSHIRLTVDEAADLEFVGKIIAATGPDTPWLEYVDLLSRHPEWLALNAAYQRNEGYHKSVEQD